MTAGKRLGVAFVLAGVLLAPGLAHADAASKERADALFKEGRALFDQKNYDEACPKLAESYDLEPGAGTILALALCHEGQGKTATAWAELKEAAALGRKNGRAELANAASKRAAAMEPNLSRVVIHLPQTPTKVPYEVKLDGAPLAEDDFATPLAVDHGEHKVEVSAKGKASRIYVIRVSGPGATEVVVEELADAPRAVVAPPTQKASRAATEDVESYNAPADGEPANVGKSQRTIGLVTAGVGVVSLGVGGYFASRAVRFTSEARTCTECNKTALNTNARGATQMAVGLGVGGTIALGVGAILYFTAPRSAPARGAGPSARTTARIVPEAGPSQVGLGVVGTF